jgi:hypothetical protein
VNGNFAIPGAASITNQSFQFLIYRYNNIFFNATVDIHYQVASGDQVAVNLRDGSGTLNGRHFDINLLLGDINFVYLATNYPAAATGHLHGDFVGGRVEAGNTIDQAAVLGSTYSSPAPVPITLADL